MAQGDNEHRMLFDLRGKRRNLVKVVYATLAVLMGLSLFLVIGGFNIAELFQSNNTASEAAEQFEERAERIEAKLEKTPEDPDLLVSLTRAQINAGNSLVDVDANGQTAMTPEAFQAYERAVDTWSKYLKVTDEPAATVALLVGPTFFSMAEYSRTLEEARRNVTAAAEAQKIVAEQRPSINAYSTLAYYTYFTGDFDAAEAAKEKAKKFANGKAEVEALEKQLGEIRQSAQRFDKEIKRAEQQAKAERAKGGAGGEAAPELEEGQNPLGEGLGGLGE
jgi:tetratricopeptide (TPR) repeat protein